ncbi:uncharacterized protein [Coffea arabica]|uniref:Reverse transcriptase zinc-binding domain-containing protein n=1 Tax=Coffea arabica TaxID=13443 RepID=A0ABM4WQ44_COFAR
MNVRDFVQKGTRKKIGNGKATNIWEDNWIPGNKDGRVTSTRPQDCTIRRVDELISGFRWRKPLVPRTFNRKDADEILDIPISISGREDGNYWLHSGNGIYTVNSGYKTLSRETTQHIVGRADEAETSSANSNGKQWKWLWKLRVKRKIKHFIWRSLNGLLPVNALVFNRTNHGDPICDGCGDQNESIEHMFFQCCRAQEVWKMAPIQWDGLTGQTGNFRVWWNAMLEASGRIEGREHIELTTNILWQIWKRRNEWKFNAKREHPWKTVNKAQQEWQEQVSAWSNEIMTPEDAGREGGEVEPVEVRSDEVQIKISTSVQEQTKCVGIGILAINHSHQVMSAWGLIDRKAVNQLQTIAEAVKMAIIKARHQQWQKITVHVPSPQLLKVIMSGVAKDIKMSTLADDINNLRALFQKCSFCLDGRLDKRCDLISDYALGILQDEEWINSQCV